ncbi:UDP-glucoronosyl and UDP-glucosyl transferase domain-containing protein [Ditylenchus destructor]|nr:UDP-glucoronosyl and UDP-glucosyl transferase domain-containing protein [Ditylenchus destructor]
MSMGMYLRSLRDAGHNITVIQTGSDTKPNQIGENISVVVFNTPPLGGFQNHIDQLFWKTTTHGWDLSIILKLNDDTLGYILDNFSEKIRDLLNEDWNLLIADPLFNPIGFAFTMLLKKTRHIPFIAFHTTNAPPTDYFGLGLGKNWAIDHFGFEPLPLHSNDWHRPEHFTDRISAVVENALEPIYYYLMPQYMPTNVLRLTSDIPYSIQEQHRQSSAMFTDRPTYFGEFGPVAPDVRYFGNYCLKLKQLNDPIKSFVEDPNSKGTIYMALGSLTTWTACPQNVFNAFVDAFNELTDYRIIFVYTGNMKPKVGTHLMILKWAPQSEILSHPKTKVFFTHVGLKSVKEAICTDTPMVLFPLFAEQSRNSKILLKMKLGTAINKYHVTKIAVKNALLQVLDDPGYEKRVKSYHMKYLDSPIALVEEAKIMTEKIIKNPQRKIFFERQSKVIGWTAYLHLDLLSVVILSVIFLKL